MAFFFLWRTVYPFGTEQCCSAFCGFRLLCAGAFFGVLLGLTSCHTTHRPGSRLILDDAAYHWNALKSGTLVVRIPTQGKKITVLERWKSSPGIPDSKQRTYTQMIQQAKMEDDTYFASIDSAFSSQFHFSRVVYVPDSLYVRFLQGERTVFITPESTVAVTQSVSHNYYQWLADESRLQFRLTDAEGNHLPKPLPYRKNTFLPAFRRWFTPRTYVVKQVNWLQNELSSFTPEAVYDKK